MYRRSWKGSSVIYCTAIIHSMMLGSSKVTLGVPRVPWFCKLATIPPRLWTNSELKQLLSLFQKHPSPPAHVLLWPDHLPPFRQTSLIRLSLNAPTKGRIQRVSKVDQG